MKKPVSVMDNEIHKILLNFEIQMYPLMSARRPDQVIVLNKRKRTCRIVDIAVRADHRVKLKDREKKDSYHDLMIRIEKN